MTRSVRHGSRLTSSGGPQLPRRARTTRSEPPIRQRDSIAQSALLHSCLRSSAPSHRTRPRAAVGTMAPNGSRTPASIPAPLPINGTPHLARRHAVYRRGAPRPNTGVRTDRATQPQGAIPRQTTTALLRKRSQAPQTRSTRNASPRSRLTRSTGPNRRMPLSYPGRAIAPGPPLLTQPTT